MNAKSLTPLVFILLGIFILWTGIAGRTGITLASLLSPSSIIVG